MKRILVLLLLIASMITLGSCGEKEPTQNNSQTHSWPVSEVTTATVNRDSEECIGKNYEALERELRAAGFWFIDTEAIDDLTHSQAEQVGATEFISINGETSFVEGQEFEKGSRIVIRYHDYRNCTVSIHVDFVSNLLFNRYDVDFRVDGRLEETMEHGTDSDFELHIKAGTHTLSFEKDESSSVKGQTTIVVDGNMQINYQISCYGDEVIVETLYTEILECATSEHILDDATCTKAKMCTICGKSEGEVLGHTWIDATCTTAKVCSVCQTTEGDPLGHSVGEWTVLQAETCSTDGVKTGVCSICSDTVEESIPQTGAHAYGGWTVISEPSCTAEGLQSRVCSNCQHEETSTIEMLEHKCTEAIISEATYYDAGTKGQKCSVCGSEGETNKYYTYYETSLKKIFKAYKANEISADEKFDGMYIEFSAKISGIEQGGLFSYGTIVFEVDNGAWVYDEVKCKIRTSEQLEYVKELIVGDKVTIKGRVDSVLYDKDFGSTIYIDIMEIE